MILTLMLTKVSRARPAPTAGLVLLLFLGLVGCDSASTSTVSSTSPDFSMENYRNKWFVLNYWAEWCTPCIKEIPEFNELQADHPDRIAVAAVNFDQLPKEELLETSQRMGIKYEILEEDPADQLRLSVPNSLPTTYIFNPQGELAAKLVGPQTKESLLSHTDIR